MWYFLAFFYNFLRFSFEKRIILHNFAPYKTILVNERTDNLPSNEFEIVCLERFTN